VAMATYNGERFLREQLNSILWQTYSNLELIIADDCSTDGTREILREYVDRYPNVHVYLNETNLGMVKNFEKALRHCSGELIAWSDQDDIWLPDKIQYLFDNLDDDVTMVYHDSAYVDSAANFMNKKVSDFRNLVSGRNLFAMDAEGGLFICGHASLFRSKLLNRALPLNKYITHDGWIIYVAMLEGNLKALTDVKVLYRQHDSNVYGGPHSRVKRSDNKSPVEYNLVERTDALLSMLSDSDVEFRIFLEKMRRYYLYPSFINNVKRMYLRFKYINKIYTPRKRNILRKSFRIFRQFSRQ
jgi:glycosyltransferase involved in cell wall biosynthesis